MKNIKNILTAIVAVAVLALSSCTDMSIDSQSDYPKQFSVDAQPEYNLSASSASNITFNVNSYSAWSISSDSEWCRPTPQSSSVSSLISAVTVVTDDNEAFVPRSAKLTITMDDKSLEPVEVVVHQLDQERLLVTPIEKELEMGGETIAFAITTNRAWRASAADSWLTFAETTGEGSQEEQFVTAIAEANDIITRQTEVTIESESKSVSFTVTQIGSTLKFTPESGDTPTLELAKEGETAIYNVEATIDWSVESDNDDVVVKKLNATQIEVSAQSNIFSTRSANVYLVSTSGPSAGLKSQPLVVTQPTNLNIDGNVVMNADGSMTFTKDTDNNAYYITNDLFKYGTFTWTFTGVSLSDGFLDISARAPSPFNGNFQIGFGEFPSFGNRFRSGGSANGVGVWVPITTFTLLDADLNQMHTLEYKVVPNDSVAGKLYIEVKINGNVIFTKENLPDPWLTADAVGFNREFGMIGATARGSFTVTSCDYVPYIK